MVPGFNTDFKYRGETYHVQTEDNGVGNPVVVTLLYHKGAILASRRTPYHEIAGKPGFEQELMALMKTQHKDLMRALLAGAYDKNGAAPAIAEGRGAHPADAAAEVSGGPPMPAAKLHPEPAPATAPQVSAAAIPAPSRAAAPVAATLTLDAAIRRYLQEFAAAAATTH